jgi:hypothetical protein
MLIGIATIVASTVASQLPPVPPGYNGTNVTSAATNGPAMKTMIDVEFSPECSHCGETNKYRFVVEGPDVPMFKLSGGYETSTNLVHWDNVVFEVPAIDDARFFRRKRYD